MSVVFLANDQFVRSGQRFLLVAVNLVDLLLVLALHITSTHVERFLDETSARKWRRFSFFDTGPNRLRHMSRWTTKRKATTVSYFECGSCSSPQIYEINQDLQWIDCYYRYCNVDLFFCLFWNSEEQISTHW